MLKENLQCPETPCSGIELLNYAAANDGSQILAYKQLAGGAAWSSYTVTWYSDAQTFDVFADIADDWEKLSREEFYRFYGEERLPGDCRLRPLFVFCPHVPFSEGHFVNG